MRCLYHRPCLCRSRPPGFLQSAFIALHVGEPAEIHGAVFLRITSLSFLPPVKRLHLKQEDRPVAKMSFRFFETKERVSVYQKYMIPTPEKVHDVILSYLEGKKGRNLDLAVDIGCGSGQSTRFLAAHFQKVVGVDISEAQIQEARNDGSSPNVSYLVAAAEKMPFEDNSVDLITASVAAHWFNMKEFMIEVNRILKPNGCLAMSSLNTHFDLYYKDCSQSASDVLNEAYRFLSIDYCGGRSEQLQSEYKEIFDAVHLADKTRISNILQKCTMSIAALLKFTESLCLYQNFLSKDPEAAKQFLQELQERFLKTMGVSSTDTELEVVLPFFCVMARKAA